MYTRIGLQYLIPPFLMCLWAIVFFWSVQMIQLWHLLANSLNHINKQNIIVTLIKCGLNGGNVVVMWVYSSMQYSMNTIIITINPRLYIPCMSASPKVMKPSWLMSCSTLSRADKTKREKKVWVGLKAETSTRLWTLWRKIEDRWRFGPIGVTHFLRRKKDIFDLIHYLSFNLGRFLKDHFNCKFEYNDLRSGA